jgi:ABC-2 type transport system permease protein
MIMSIAGLVVVLFPLYFIANALQPTMQGAIGNEANQYFAFVAIGAAVFSLASTCATALPSALDGAISRGTFEAMLGTPARVRSICAGMMGYPLLWGMLRATIVVGAAILLGARLSWHGLPAGVLVLALTMLSYVGFGLIFGALILAFRTTGFATTAVLTGSMFLGGVYYPTKVIPSWISNLSSVFPLTYGLRALRQLVLRDASLFSVATDIEKLVGLSLLLLAVGAGLIAVSLRYARRAGTLASY